VAEFKYKVGDRVRGECVSGFDPTKCPREGIVQTVGSDYLFVSSPGMYGVRCKFPLSTVEYIRPEFGYREKVTGERISDGHPETGLVVGSNTTVNTAEQAHGVPGILIRSFSGGYVVLDLRTVKRVEKAPELVLKDDLTARETILETAKKLVTFDRNKSYGAPEKNFENTAKLWTAQLGHKLKDDEEFTATDVAILMTQLKLARMIAAPKADNFADAIGYLACGVECEVEAGRIPRDDL
jgi:hypothetical protein